MKGMRSLELLLHSDNKTLPGTLENVLVVPQVTIVFPLGPGIGVVLISRAKTVKSPGSGVPCVCSSEAGHITGSPQCDTLILEDSPRKGPPEICWQCQPGCDSSCWENTAEL